jgi:hypothetical protein
MGVPEDLAHFEQTLQDLIIKYEQYFLGLEKREPLKLLEEVDRFAQRYRNINIVNTMLKFKYNSLVSTLSTHKQKWARIIRLMEEGKYSRDRFKMELHKGQTPQKKAVPPPENNHDVDRLYRELVQARQACNLPVDKVSQEMIAAAIAKQKPQIMSKHGCREVEFKVVIEAGTPKIKARPKQ